MPNLHLIQLRRIVAEAAPVLTGGIIRHISQNDEVLTLEIRAGQENFYLLLSLERGATRCHLVRTPPQAPPTPPAFCQLLRKHVDGGHLVSMEVASDDRVVTMAVVRGTEPVDQFLLTAELWGGVGNIFLVDSRQQILGSLQHYHYRQQTRLVAPGQLYQRLPAAPLKNLQEYDDFLKPLCNTTAQFPWNSAAESFYGHEREQFQQQQQYDAWMRRLAKEIERSEKQLHKLQQDLTAAANREQLKRWGELLKTVLFTVPRNAHEVVVPDYFAPDMPLVKIPLDPQLSARDNMERYFKRYQKLTRGAVYLQEKIKQLGDDLVSLHALYQEAQQTPAAELLTLQSKLPSRFSQPVAVKANKAKAAPHLPFYKFYSVDGWNILVGRSAKENEMLTFRLARGNDWWFHTQDYPGSHVLVRAINPRDLPQETLLDAAHLAAHYSQAREHAKVNVIYTRRKFISKPKHAKPGAVLAGQEKHIQVAVDAERLLRLLESRKIKGDTDE